MYENTPALKVLDAVPAVGNKIRGRPPRRWRVQVEKELAALAVETN